MNNKILKNQILKYKDEEKNISIPSDSLKAQLEVAKNKAKNRGLFLLESDIIAYVWGDLELDKSVILEKRMAVDPEFAARVAYEQAIIEGIRQKFARQIGNPSKVGVSVEPIRKPKSKMMKDMEEITPTDETQTTMHIAASDVGEREAQPQPQSKVVPISTNYRKWMMAAAAVFVIFFFYYWNPEINIRPIASEKDTKDINQSADHRNANTPPESKPKTQKLPHNTRPEPIHANPELALMETMERFAQAVAQCAIIKERKIAMKGGNAMPNFRSTDSKQSPTGFFWQHENKVYFITNASSVSLASSEIGAVEGQTPSGERILLTLKGSNALYDVAVLEADHISGEQPIMATLDDERLKLFEITYLFEPGQNGVKVAPNISEGHVTRIMGNFFSTSSMPNQIALHGPIFNKFGRVIGLLSRFAADNLPDLTHEPNSQQAISSELLQKIVLKLIQNGQQAPPFIGAKFVPNEEGKIIVSTVIQDSPASSSESNLQGVVVDSINGIAINQLGDVAEAFLNTKTGEKAHIVSTLNGLQQKTTLETRSWKTPERLFEDISAIEIKEMSGFRKNFGPGQPSLIRQTEGQPEERFHIVAYQSKNEGHEQWSPVLTVADLGQGFQIMGLSGGGIFKLLQENTNNEETLKIDFKNLYLWQ